MSDYPDLTNYGYKIVAELGRNRAGGRITWKAIATETETTVAIKQFCFARSNSSWSGYKAHLQEIEMLQKLSYPSIPQYLGSMEMADGFCLIQEYVEATPCKDFRALSVAEVKTVAGKILDILIYLQQQQPIVLHRDLSTDNILLAESLAVYLIDFGFARLAGEDSSNSSILQGTPGFIAPEQIIQPSTASDIYSLGVVLVCLLTHKDIAEISALNTADDPYQLDIKKLLPDLERDFRNWLEKMTSAKVSQRFADARSAQQALRELDSALTWLEETDDSALTKESIQELAPTNLKLQTVTGVMLISVSAIATWGVNFAYSQVELTVVSVIIALLAALAIAVTQLGAAAIASAEPKAKIQSLILSTLIPAFLVTASSLIWGGSEAVIISAAVVVAEVCLLAYYWGQLPSRNFPKLVKSGMCLSAIAIGIGAALYI